MTTKASINYDIVFEGEMNNISYCSSNSEGWLCLRLEEMHCKLPSLQEPPASPAEAENKTF